MSFGHDPLEDATTFNDYYKIAKDQLKEEQLHPGSKEPTDKEIKDRAAQLLSGDQNVDYERYKEERKAAKRWLNSPSSEAELLKEIKSQFATQGGNISNNNMQIDQSNQKEKFTQEANVSHHTATFFPRQENSEINTILVLINQCSQRYLKFGYNNQKKYKAIQEAVQRATQAFAQDPMMSVQDFLTKDHFRQSSIKQAFELSRWRSKSNAFEELLGLVEKQVPAKLGFINSSNSK